MKSNEESGSTPNNNKAPLPKMETEAENLIARQFREGLEIYFGDTPLTDKVRETLRAFHRMGFLQGEIYGMGRTLMKIEKGVERKMS